MQRISSVPSGRGSEPERPSARNNWVGETTIVVNGSTVPSSVQRAAFSPSSSSSSRLGRFERYLARLDAPLTPSTESRPIP